MRGALQLLQLPKVLGQDGGVDIKVSNGKFGPYVQKEKEYRSLPNDGTIFTITLKEALALLAQPKSKSKRASALNIELGEDKKTKNTLTVKSGRYGAYVSDGTTNASIPKTKDPQKITLEEAIELIQNKKK